MTDTWDGRTFTNGPPLFIDELTIFRNPFYQPLTRRRRRRLRGGKTQSSRPRFTPWFQNEPLKIARGALITCDEAWT